MTKSELWSLHDRTLAERDAASWAALEAEDGSRAERLAVKEVERLEKGLEKLREKRLRWPSLNRHAPDCWCGGCEKIGSVALPRLSETEEIVKYGIKVPRSLNEALRGKSAEVRQALEKIAGWKA